MYDLIIVGAGPAGLTAGIYAKRANLNVLILEKAAPGGQVVLTNEVENYPGFSKIKGLELAKNMAKSYTDLGGEIKFQTLVNLEKQEDNTFKLNLKFGEVLFSKSVVIATGARSRTLGLENEQNYIGNGISTCATCDGAFYKDLSVIVVGGGNSAVEEAFFLASICKKVSIIQNLDHFTAHPKAIDDLAKKDNVEYYFGSKVVSYLENDFTLKGVRIEQKDQTQKEIFADGVFLFIGLVPNTQSLENLNVLNDWGYVKTNEEFKTNINGLFAIGDCIEKRIRQIVTATSDGAQVINYVQKYLKDEF